MIFASPFFLFFFLPVVLGFGLILPQRWRNLWLLTSSLFFYAWGEFGYTLLFLGSIVGNYTLGLAAQQARNNADPTRSQRRVRQVMVSSAFFNLGILCWFKYAGFFFDNLSEAARLMGLPALPHNDIHLPIGISFFTFQGLSYVIDVARGSVEAQRNLIKFSTYLSFFPQLIAGPIVRYIDVARFLDARSIRLEQFTQGVERFIVGLSKKVLIANTLATTADAIFDTPAGSLSAEVAWLGIACYTLQLYYDFSGYSDMAIGLGKLFGFDFPENFRHPLAATSMTDFWRRWHISLSSWFRDYLYIPLGGNRQGPIRTARNLAIVFLLCGLWHGAGWTFILWGMAHGVVLILERVGLERLIQKIWPLGFLYVPIMAMLTFVLFRADSLAYAFEYYGALFGLGSSSHSIDKYWDWECLVTLLTGWILMYPWAPWIGQISHRVQTSRLALLLKSPLILSRTLALTGLLWLSSALLVSGTYNPFIYFKF